VDISELERQALDRRGRETAAAQARAAEEALQLEIDAQVQRNYAEAESIRKKNAEMIAKRQKEQAEAKQQRDVVLKEVYSNKLDTTAYFSQFGTSHR
jgi:CO/xanthine dehydrogenase Mo-binding subunit